MSDYFGSIGHRQDQAAFHQKLERITAALETLAAREPAPEPPPIMANGLPVPPLPPVGPVLDSLIDTMEIILSGYGTLIDETRKLAETLDEDDIAENLSALLQQATAAMTAMVEGVPNTPEGL